MTLLAKDVVLTSADLIVVAGRPVFTFAGVPGLDPRGLHGRIVTIDGHRYRVSGVETHAIVDASGFPFGLRVDRVHEGQAYDPVE